MIHRIYSGLESFRELKLRAGLNILLADKSETATDRQTRNGAGKTSLIELIHFIFGGRVDQDSIFSSDELASWRFGIEFDLAGERTTVERSGVTHSKLIVATGDGSQWPIQPSRDKSSGELAIANSKWRTVLGDLMFGLPAHRVDERGRFGPTFRSLFSYFVRRQDSGGFSSYLPQSNRQPPWVQHVAVSYLLGLDWSISQSFQELREQEKVIRDLKKLAKQGTLPGFRGTVASLRTEVTIAESKAKDLKAQLDHFNVVPEYQSIESEAATLTQEMNCLGNENTADRQLLGQLRDSLESERAPEITDLEGMYQEIGIVLPELVTRRLEEAVEFNRVIIENRRSHLRSEIERVVRCIAERDEKKQKMEVRRSQLMGILKSGGALDQYTMLQGEYTRLSAVAETLKQQLLIAEKLESSQTKAEIERKQLQERLQQDFHEQAGALNEAIVLFEELSETLYERAGSLTVGATDNGPTFEIHIDAQRSQGITNMQIFCFDLMLAVIASRHGRTPGFLVHDSHLFDGVDERQVAKAIQIGKRRAEECGFQYLITMNSDALPEDGFDPDFDIQEHVLPVNLDDTATGSLFGLRFN